LFLGFVDSNGPIFSYFAALFVIQIYPVNQFTLLFVLSRYSISILALFDSVNPAVHRQV